MKRTGTPPRPCRYDRCDWGICFVICLIVFLLCFGYLTQGISFWGDDNAAYISEGIAIARGEFEEQTRRNVMLHPTPISMKEVPENLVYVWGYPLLLAIVYRLTGYDTVNFSSGFFYKFPSLICLSLLGGVCYLLYRRRFSRWLSMSLSFILCLSRPLFENVDQLYCDVCFLFFAMLTLLLMEVFIESPATVEGGRIEQTGNRPPSILLGIALGAALWYTYETRLNGNAICAAAFCAHLLSLLPKQRRPGRSPAILLRYALPYLVFFALRLASERIFLLPATSNLSDIGKLKVSTFLGNLKFYPLFTLHTLKSLVQLQRLPLSLPLAVLIACGLFTHGFRRENLHYTLLLGGTYVVLVLLPYRQNERYLLHVLPILLLYTAFGAQRLLRKLARRFPKAFRACKRIAALALLAFLIVNTAVYDYHNLEQDRRPNQGMYSTAMIGAYHYIQEHLPDDAIIASKKPRAIYLNTGRMGFRPNFNGHDPAQADYWLLRNEQDASLFGFEDMRDFTQLEYAYGDVRLYRFLGEPHEPTS